MIRFLNILSMFLLMQLTTMAQQDERRTSTTKIADLLATQPAENTIRLDGAFDQLNGFSDADIAELFLRLKPQGNDNAKIEYATNSYAYYVMQQGKEAHRATFVRGALDALSRMADKDNKGFVINLLANAGKDDAVAGLAPYLKDEYLADRAARALAGIKIPAAGRSLLEALPGSAGSVQLSIVQALGDVGYQEAEQAIIPLVSADAVALKRVAMYTLSKLALPTSAEILRDAAEGAGSYDTANAMASYIVYLNNLADKGEKELAARMAETLWKDSKEQTATRIAAMAVLAKIHGKTYLPQLVKAAQDEQVDYSVAAFELAIPLLDKQTLPYWTKGLKKANPHAQVMILRTLADNGDEQALPAARWAMKSKDANVRKAAILALSKLNGETAAPLLLSRLQKASETDREAIEEALLTVRNTNLSTQLTAGLPHAAPVNQSLLVRVLSNRGAVQAFPTISDLLRSQDTTVKATAYAALPHVSTREHLPVLLGLLISPDLSHGEKHAVQQAMVVAINEGDQKEQDTQMLLDTYVAASEEQKALYLPVFSGVGGEAALGQLVADLDRTDNRQLRDEIVRALADWEGAEALHELVKLSRTVQDDRQYDAVLKGLLRMVGQSALPAEQRVLILRDAMETTRTASQKRMVLRSLEANNTYNALVFAGKFLDDGELRSTAAMAVLNIALRNPNLYGADIRKILDKTVGALSGNDSDYLRQALIKHISELPKGQGYVSLFNGKDLDGWKGLVENPIKRAKMDASSLARAQQQADDVMKAGWYVKDGVLFFNGKGDNIATVRQYGDFELLVDWKLSAEGKDGDAGIYPRGMPQVQIWDTARVHVGALVGSGGLYNNQVHESKPLKVADNRLGEWNTFRIVMKGDKVTVYLNGELVTDNVVMENYWDRSLPIFPVEQIELQAHGTVVAYRDIYIRELPRKEQFKLNKEEEKEGFKVLFDGTNMDAWTGNTTAYTISEEGTLAIYPTEGSGGNLYSKDEYADFVYRFEFRLTPGANNGIGLRAPMEGDAAYTGMEIQVLDDGADIYKDIKPYQFTGSVYGVIPARPGYLRPVGEWNEEEIQIKGNKIQVTLNGTVIVDGDLAAASKNGTVDGRKHPGLLRRAGHLAFLGHGSEVHFRHLRIKEL